MPEPRRHLRRELLRGLLAVFVLLAGCGREGVPSRPLGTPPPPPTRPSDGLLRDPELQRIVDLQVERDGEALAGLLSHPDPRVRARAAFALGSVQEPGASARLVALLRDPDPGVRRDAAFALGQLGEAALAPALVAALEVETDPQARRALLEALGKTGDAGILEALLGLEIPRGAEGAWMLALARMGARGIALPGGVELLVEALRSGYGETRERGAYFFARSPASGEWRGRADEIRAVLDSLPPGEPAAMHLLGGLAVLGDPRDTPRFLWWVRSSPDWRIRTSAVRALGGRTADPRVREALREALEEPSTHVAVSAAQVMASADQLSPRERDALEEWVERHPEDWRRAGPILAMLGRLGRGELLDRWLRQWEEGEVAPRTRGLGALAFVPGEEATRTLREAASSSNSRIRGTALSGLARRWRVERGDSSVHGFYFEAFREGLGTGDPAAIFIAAPALADSAFLPLGSLDLLMDKYRRLSPPGDVEGMAAILGALGETGAAEAEPFLREALTHPHGSVRRAAARSLSNLKGEEAEPGSGGGEAERRVDWERLASLGERPRLVLETERGRVVLELDPETAPLTVQTVLGFAGEGLYDGVPFHRVVPNFVVQGGDFARQDGFGGPGFSIRSEFTSIPFHRGVAGMASAGKDTEGSQFFLTHSLQPHLDGAYTSFGWVVEGMDVVDAILEEERILLARVEPGPA